MKLPLLFPALRTERIWTLRVTSEFVRQLLQPGTGAPLRDTRTTAYCFFSPTTAELASAGIECRAPASGPPRDLLVFAVAVLGRRDFFVTPDTIAT